jgi:hypothetical protein
MSTFHKQKTQELAATVYNVPFADATVLLLVVVKTALHW